MSDQGGLKNIASKSFTSPNLFEISLVKDTAEDLPYYKPMYFFFISMTPVEQGQQGRTFNRQARVNMKCDVEKLRALSHSLKLQMRGNKEAQFAIFADPSRAQGGGGSGDIKSCFTGVYQKKDNRWYVTLAFKTGQNNPFGMSWTFSDALSVCDIIDKFCDKCLDLEFERSLYSIGKPKQQTNGPVNNTNPQPNQNNNPNPSNNVVNNFVEGMNENAGGSAESPFPGLDDAPF